LVFLQHFRGGMDNWDPWLTDGMARNRPVILFDNAGVAASSGQTPDTVEALADDFAMFLAALRLDLVDVLGFSLGGSIAQELVIRHPALVRRLILSGAGPRGGVPRTDPRVAVVAGNPVPTREDFLFLFFSPSASSQLAGRAFWERRHQRTIDVDPPSSEQTMRAQTAAGAAWREPRDEPFAYLRSIEIPTLVTNGNNDIMIPTINSYHLAQHIPNAQLILYPDSGHGALFQHVHLYLKHAEMFLDGDYE
jgi:pimeloyl-ACP methyl ester carboxylesterase